MPRWRVRSPFEHTASGRRPTGGVAIRVRSKVAVVTTTDADGRYSNRPVEVHIVSKAVLWTTGVPDSYPITSILVSGTIFETTSDGPRPAPGALVALGDEPTLSYSTDAVRRARPFRAPHRAGGWDERGVSMELRQR
jgi:hypothetical protein